MVAYNKAAMRFYERNDFVYAKTLRRHYFIADREYDAHVYFKRINGFAKRTRPAGKLRWLWNALSRLNILGSGNEEGEGDMEADRGDYAVKDQITEENCKLHIEEL